MTDKEKTQLIEQIDSLKLDLYNSDVKNKFLQQQIDNFTQTYTDIDGNTIASIINQIKRNQKFVEHIQNCHNCGSIGWSNCKFYRRNLLND